MAEAVCPPIISSTEELEDPAIGRTDRRKGTDPAPPRTLAAAVGEAAIDDQKGSRSNASWAISELMVITRRIALAAGALAVMARAATGQQVDPWFAIMSDEGKPLPNMRLPIELSSEVEELPGAIWVGSKSHSLTLVEFFDYNCPYCRKAMTDLHALAQDSPDLRLGLVNNPILSSGSEQAARVEQAVLRLGGPDKADEFHRRLFQRRGVIDRAKALDIAAELGAPTAEIARRAETAEVQSAISRQMSLAASLGMAVTPSFMIAGAGIAGYPGPASLKRIVAAVRVCGQIVC